MKTYWKARTNKGRVVYDRAFHPFRPADVLRIAKSFSDEDTQYFKRHFDTFYEALKVVGVNTILGIDNQEQKQDVVKTLLRFIQSVDPEYVIMALFL